MRAITLDPRDLDRPLAIPCGNCAFDDRDAFRRVTSHRFPGFRSCETLSGLNALPNPAHRSRLGAASACVSTDGSELLGQRRVSSGRSCDHSGVATRDASDRLLPSHVPRTSTRASSAPGFVVALACSALLGDSPSSRKDDSLRRVTRNADGRSCFPSHYGMTVPLTPLSQLSWCAARSRG